MKNRAVTHSTEYGCVAAVSVGKGHRAVLPKQIKVAVSWLRVAKSGINCTLKWMSDVPALELLPSQPIQSAGVETDDRQILRGAGSAWPMKLELYGNTYRFTVPEHVRRIGLLPGESGTMILFGCRDFLEFWRPEDWRANLRLMSTNRLPD